MSDRNVGSESRMVEVPKSSNLYGKDEKKFNDLNVSSGCQTLNESDIKASYGLPSDPNSKDLIHVYAYESDHTNGLNSLSKIISDPAKESNTFDRYECESTNDKHSKSKPTNLSVADGDGIMKDSPKVNRQEACFADLDDDRFSDDDDRIEPGDLDFKLPPPRPPEVTFGDLHEHFEKVIANYIATENPDGPTVTDGVNDLNAYLPSDNDIHTQIDSSDSLIAVKDDPKKVSMKAKQSTQDSCSNFEDDDRFLDDDQSEIDVDFKPPPSPLTVEDLHEHIERVIADYIMTKKINISEPQTTSECSCNIYASVSNPLSYVEGIEDAHYGKQNDGFEIVKEATEDLAQPSFVSMPVLHKSSFPLNSDVAQSSLMDDGDDDDDFGDFSGFKSAEPKESSFQKPMAADDFADFSGFQKSAPPPTTNISAILVKNNLFHMRTALDSAFLTDRLAGLDVFFPSKHLLSKVDEGFKAQLTELWEKTSSVAVNSLLTSVSNYPESFASQQVWNSSYTYSMYLATIGVDIRSAPLTRIKLLEPSRVEDLSSTATSPSSAPPRSLPTEAPECDWLASGFTENVTEADLDLFEDMPYKSTSKPKGPVSDLEAEFLHSVIPPPPIIPTPTPPTTLLAMFPTPITAETRISENISNVLEHLPDFSYLRKSILAFPIQDQTE